MPATSGDRVLIHLQSRGEPEGWTGGVSDQDLIASMCGIGRTHVPRVLRPLIDDGLISEEPGRVPGKSRRVKVYSLTDRGQKAADQTRTIIGRKMVYWTDETGRRRSARTFECLDLINGHLMDLSMARLPASLFLSLPVEDLTWNDIIWTAASLKDKDGKGLSLPEGWSTVSFSPRFEGLSFERGKLDEIDHAIISGMVVLKGKEEAGKEDLIELWARSRKRKALWLVKGRGGNKKPEGGPWDLLVLIGGADPDVSDLLKGRREISDPRDQLWPPRLRDIDIILTTSIESDIEGPVVEVDGLSMKYFIERSSKAGLEEGLSGELFSSTRGSPEALEVLLNMDREAVNGLNGMDRQDAVLKVLLCLKGR